MGKDRKEKSATSPGLMGKARAWKILHKKDKKSGMHLLLRDN
jgi:hypothetical protein